MLACASCGTQLVPEARFCIQCGVERAPVSSVRPTPGVEPAGERRQLTVVFCDLVGSTALGERLDPEALREVLGSFQDTCGRAVESFGGHIAQYLGDGVLIYFGYPVAYEDSAERAVRAGLSIQHELAQQPTLSQTGGMALEARIGIHTGEVVIGEIGNKAHTERLAQGATLNIAARLEGIAEPGTVVISDVTLRLVSGIFVIEDLGTPALRGVDRKLRVYRVERASGVPDRLGVATSLTPHVARERELAQLEHGWQETLAGSGRVVLLSGDGGVGKSRLVREFHQLVAETPHTLTSAHCVSYASGSGFDPLVRLIRGELDFATAEDPVALLASALRFPGLDPQTTIPFVAQLLGLPPSEQYPLLAMSPELQRLRTLEALAAIPAAVSQLQPLLYVFEDLHWADPSTLAYLELLIDRLPSMRVMLVLTHRPEFQVPAAFARSHATSIALERLTPAQVVSLVHAAAECDVPQEVANEISLRAEGVPLYAEELIRSVVGSGALDRLARDADANPGPLEFGIPSTLKDSLMARLDRLGSPKAVAQLAATLGREFDYDLLEAVSNSEPASLRRSLGELVESDVLQQRGEFPDAHFAFSHALVHDVAYGSQLIATRLALHAKVVETIEARFPERGEAAPHWMVRHAIRGKRDDRAVHYAERAADVARNRLANEEAAKFYQTAIGHLQALPADAERDAREVTLQLGRAGSLSIARGYSAPEVLDCYVQIRKLNELLPKGPLQLPGWLGLAQHATMIATFPELLEAGRQILDISESLPVPALHATGHLLCGIGATTSSDPRTATRHLEEAVRIASENPAPPPTPSDPDIEVAARATLYVSYLQMGDLDEAMEQERVFLERARKLDHAASLALALTMASAAAQLQHDLVRTRSLAEEARDLSAERGFVAWRWQGALRSLCARLEMGEPATASEVEEAWEGLRSAGAHSTDAVQQFNYALSLELTGDHERAMEQFDEADAVIQRTGEGGLVSTARLFRGIALARSGDVDGATAMLRAAVSEVTGIQTLVCAVQLGEILRDRGDESGAREILAEAFSKNRGGDAVPIVRAARALYAELGSGSGS